MKIIYADLQQGAVLRVHGGLPQLVGVHFTQTFVTLDGQPFLESLE